MSSDNSDTDDLINIAKKINNVYFDDEAEELAETFNRNQTLNLNQTYTDIRLVGDKQILGEVVQLLAYIRHALKNNISTDILVKIGNETANPEFMFDVNGFQVKDFTTQDKAYIN